MELIEDRPARSFAVMGADYPGLRPALSVAEGDEVQAGQVLLTDRTHPRVAFVSPVAARVVSVEYGPRRSLSALVLHRAETQEDAQAPAAPPDMTGRAALTGALLSRGMWPMFRTRPFGRFPDPAAVPDAIFVTATDTEPLAPDPRVTVAGREQAFRAGVELLASLTDGPVHVCQSPGAPLAPESARIRNAVFDGAHPAGLAGTHIERLHPVGPGRQVWTVDCQDVAAIGHLAETGHYDPSRIVAITGAHLPTPELIRTIPGASLREVAGEDGRILSGSGLSGREASWLGRFHRQITRIAPDGRDRPWLRGRARPGLPPRPIIPTAALGRALPPQFLPVPLMRALAVGDIEAAARLGALSLIEEDMALAGFLCTSGADYGSLLRRVLEELEMAA